MDMSRDVPLRMLATPLATQGMRMPIQPMDFRSER